MKHNFVICTHIYVRICIYVNVMNLNEQKGLDDTKSELYDRLGIQ